MRVAVVANGDWDIEWGKQELSHYDRIIAADGGGKHIIESGYIPDVLVGDLDSLRTDYVEICRKKGTKIQIYPSEKDQTDLELALQYAVTLHQGEEAKTLNNGSLKDIFLLGAAGGRLDHLLGNIFIMSTFLKKGFRIHLKSPDHECWLLKGLQEVIGKRGQKISLLPMTEEAVVKTEGLQFPLYQEILLQGSPRGISNVFLGENAIIEVSKGTVLVIILSPDNNR